MAAIIGKVNSAAIDAIARETGGYRNTTFTTFRQPVENYFFSSLHIPRKGIFREKGREKAKKKKKSKPVGRGKKKKNREEIISRRVLDAFHRGALMPPFEEARAG